MNNLRIRITYWLSRFVIQHYFIGSRKIRRILARLLIPPNEGSITITTLHGFKLVVDPTADKYLESSLYYYGTYEPGTLNIIKNCIKEGDVFIDVGSNIGLMSLFASQYTGKDGKVYAFEPNPEVYSILCHNLKINNIRNITPFSLALGSQKNQAILFLGKDSNRGSTSLIRKKDDVHGVEVKIETLDNFIWTNKVNRVKLLKIDVEGWELEVLKGSAQLLSLPEAPIVIMECGEPSSDSRKDTYQYLLSLNNYLIFKLKKGKEVNSKLIQVNNHSKLPDQDNLFCFLQTHLKYLPRNIFT